MRSDADKFTTIISKNTFFFHREMFVERNESYIHAVTESLLLLKNEISLNKLRRETVSKLLAENEYGLFAILTLTGISNEFFKRLITLIRVVDDIELSRLVLKNEWNQSHSNQEFREWDDNKIRRLIRYNESFRDGIVNLFFEGATIQFLKRTLPLFELKKLSITKLQFDDDAIIDSLVRYSITLNSSYKIL